MAFFGFATDPSWKIKRESILGGAQTELIMQTFPVLTNAEVGSRQRQLCHSLI